MNPRVLSSGLLTILTACTSAVAWTPEAQVDVESSASAGQPAAAYDSTGRVHCVYSGNNQNLTYKFMVGDQWSPGFDLPGPNFKEVEPAIAIDSNNHVHLVGSYRVDGTINTPYSVYYWEFDGTNWTGPTLLSPGTGTDANNCGGQQIAVDRLNNLHVIWSQSHVTGASADLIYRKRLNGVWQARVNLTSNGGSSYGSVSPSLKLERGGDVLHLAWHDDFTNVATRVYYTKNTNLGDPAAWLPANQWVQISSNGYGKDPTLILDRLNHPHIFWIDAVADLNAKYLGYRYWNGSAWSAIKSFGGSANNRDANFDSINRMHLVYRDNGLQYRTSTDFVNFTNPVQINSPVDTYSADFAAVLLGYLTDNQLVIYEERKGAFPGTGHIYWTRNTTYAGATGTLTGTVRDPANNPVPGATVYAQTGDSATSAANGIYTLHTAPGTMSVSATRLYYSTHTVPGVIVTSGQTNTLNFTIVTNPTNPPVSFTATAANTSITLRWKNPSSPNFTGTLIRYKTNGFPSGPTDGLLLIDKSGSPNAQDSYEHSGLTNGISYYYAAFTHPAAASYSSAATAATAPFGPGDFDHDGDVDQADFGRFQVCFSGPAVAQNDPACQAMRLDSDDDVDLNDFGLLQGCISGANVYANPNCVP